MPSSRNANQSMYRLFCDGVEADALYVSEFTGIERLSELYSVDCICFSTRNDIDVVSLVNKRATLYLYRQDSWFPLSGIISKCSYQSKTVDYSTYYIQIRPTLFVTTLSTQCRVFQKLTIPDIIRKVLDETATDLTYELQLEGNYPEQEYIVQYNETDFNFMSRLMEQNGIWYFFREDPVAETEPGKPGDQECCIITDTSSSFPEVPFESILMYRSLSSMTQFYDEKDHENIYQLRHLQQGISAEAVVRNYQYTTPETSPVGIKKIPGGDCGIVYQYGGAFKNAAEAETAVTVLAHRIASTKTSVAGKSSCKGMRAGYRIKVVDHVREELNQPYILSSVVHHGKMMQVSGDHGPSYSNEFEGFSTDNAPCYRPAITAKKPPIPEIITARIEGCDAEYATLDEKGRYKVRMPFDLSKTPTYQASTYIRLAQLYSGSQYGVHFPVHEGAEMVIAHVNGNPDLPVGLKVVPDANTISPVTENNHTQSVIRTAGKNEINMDDNEGQKHLKVYTPGDMLQTAQHDESESTQADRKVTVGGDEKKEISENSTDNIDGIRTIDIQGNRDHSVTGDFITEVTKKGAITTSGNLTLEITGDAVETFTTSRKLMVTGNNTETIIGNHVVDAVAGSKIDSSGNLTVKADGKIGVSSQLTLTIQGNDIEIKGKSELGILSGMGAAAIAISKEGITITSPITTILAGITKSEAKNNNNVTGLAVMLN